ncbi:MAG: hypothetical protein K2N34_01150 [Lachnospiraceae bacterium]|nr:hypothetical protein [Lachnospiraceae bacterium]
MRSRFYEKETADLCICVSEHDLLDRKGQVIYTWRNMNDDAEFYNLVRHANGRNYLVF